MARRRSSRWSYDGGWPAYVPVAERRRKAGKHLASQAKRGRPVSPVVVEGRAIAQSFWGRAWCDNLESYSDYENRLPRGRSYVRNGAVVDLQIAAGQIAAQVMGSDLYQVEIAVAPTPKRAWTAIVDACAGTIDTVVELLSGRLSRGVMEILTRKGTGLFPTPKEIRLSCSCPDWAEMCKHVAAALYGIGARLDSQPELLFVLRQVDQQELAAQAGAGAALGRRSSASRGRILEGAALSSLFGIELEGAAGAEVAAQDRAGKRAPRATSRQDESPRASRRRTVRREALPTVTALQLEGRGIPRTTYQNWLTAGVLLRTPARGTYQTTPQTEPRITAALARRLR